MNEQEILSASITKAEKARRLFDLGYSRKQVADLVCGGNYGWAYNIEKVYRVKKAVQQDDPKPEQAQEAAAPETVQEENLPEEIGEGVVSEDVQEEVLPIQQEPETDLLEVNFEEANPATWPKKNKEAPAARKPKTDAKSGTAAKPKTAAKTSNSSKSKLPVKAKTGRKKQGSR